EPQAAANRSEGDQLELSVPAVEGGSIDLVDLRGRPVVMVLAETSNVEWPRALELLEGLERERGASVELVLVAADPDPPALDDVNVPCRLGWDPAGALADPSRVGLLATIS